MFTAECISVYYFIIEAIAFMILGGIYYFYMDTQFKKAAKMPEKKNKITIRVLAAGFSLAYATMLIPTAKETLDFQFYDHAIQLYYVTRAILFLGMISFGLITGGTFLSNFKGKQND